MIEPPGQPVIGTIFEIDDRILVAVELIAIECVARAMHRRRVGDPHVRVDLCSVEFSEYRSRRNAVKTIAVIKYP
jgi:hypothetical protein